MKAPFKRFFFFFIIVLNLAVVALYSQISTNTDFQQSASKQLSELLSGKSANVDEIILSLPETDLPAALGVAEQLSFKALHNDIPMSPEAVARVRQTIENRLQKAKSVSLQSSEQCPVSIPARRLNVAGTEITVPSYFVTDQPIIISQTPTGEAGTFFPTISVTVAAPPGAKLHSVFLLNGKPFPLKQESSTSLIYRPSPSAENALSIGTHTAQITVTDARGRTASATWSFTVGIKPTAQPAIDPSWPVVGSFSIPLSHLIGNSAVSGNVQIIVYQTPEGKTIQKLVVTGGKGAGELTTQDPFWLGAIFNRRSDDPITISPKTSLAFPGNSIVFTYSYSGIGTVAKEEWVIQEGSSVRKSRDAGVSWTMGKVPVRAIIYLTITVTDANGDPSEAYVSESKGVSPVLPSGLFGPDRFLSISEMATGSVPFAVQPGVFIGEHSYLLTREDPLVLGNHLISVENAHVEQISGNTHPTFEDSSATETNLLFSHPGWSEFRHVMQLRLVCGDETYKTTFEPDSYPLIGHYQASATLKFSKLPPGIIVGTQRKATISQITLTLNNESKTFSAPTLSDPWVLARSTQKPQLSPLAISGIQTLIPENNVSVPFSEFSVVLDPQLNEEHPSEFFFTPRVRPLTLGIHGNVRTISTGKVLTVPLYLEEALLETEFEPGEELTILENQNVDFTTVVKPVPGKGTGELKAGAGEIDLLEGYKVKKLEMLVWGQAHESEMPAEELKKPKRKNDVHWSYSFKPDKGTGTYFIGNGCYAMAYEPETDSEGIVSGGGQRTVTVIPGLKILSPKANFAYPQDTDITVKTTFDNSLAEWNKIKWFIGSSEVHPTPAAPGWSLKLPPGKHTLKAMYSPPNTPPVIESVTFQVVPISLKLTPERKITALPGSSTVPLKLTLSVNEVEIAKPGEEFNWLTTDFKAIASVSWAVFTAPDDIADFNLTKPYEPKIIFSDKPTAVTALATVTLHISSPAHPETVFDLTLPLARADVWGLKPPKWEKINDQPLANAFPQKAIAEAGRTFTITSGLFQFQGEPYNWPLEANKPIVFEPALPNPDVSAIAATQLAFTWSLANQTGAQAQFVALFPHVGTATVALKAALDFQADGRLGFEQVNNPVGVENLFDLITGKVEPSSFSMTIGDTETLAFSIEKKQNPTTPPSVPSARQQPIALQDGAYILTVDQVHWSYQFEGQTSEIVPGLSYTFIPPKIGNYKGTASASLKLTEQAYPAKSYPANWLFSYSPQYFHADVNEPFITFFVDGKPIGSETYYLGQQINLSYKAFNPSNPSENIAIDSQKWIVSPPILSGFSISDDNKNGMAVPVPAKDFENSSIVFCLYDFYLSEEESVDFGIKTGLLILTFRGKEYPYPFSIPYKKPYLKNVEILPPQQKIRVMVDPADSKWKIGFPATNSLGIHARAEIFNPTKKPYLMTSTSFVRLNNERKFTSSQSSNRVQFRKTISNTDPWPTPAGYWLDTYPPGKDSPEVISRILYPESHDPKAILADDIPLFLLDLDESGIPQTFNADASFVVVFWVKPAPMDKTIWCPIRRMVWAWNGKTTFDSESRKWVDDPANYSVEGLFNSPVEFPKWSDWAHPTIIPPDQGPEIPEHPFWRDQEQ